MDVVRRKLILVSIGTSRVNRVNDCTFITIRNLQIANGCLTILTWIQSYRNDNYHLTLGIFEKDQLLFAGWYFLHFTCDFDLCLKCWALMDVYYILYWYLFIKFNIGKKGYDHSKFATLEQEGNWSWNACHNNIYCFWGRYWRRASQLQSIWPKFFSCLL